MTIRRSVRAADANKPAGACDHAKQMLQRRNTIGALQRARALASKKASLRQKRRERMKVVSDEALMDLDDYTMRLAAKRK
jgi:hypothetical protein